MSDSERYDRMKRMEKEAELTRRRQDEPARKKEGRKQKRDGMTKNWQWEMEEDVYSMEW